MIFRKTHAVLLVLMLSLGMLIAAPALQAAETPKYGGTLRIAMEAEPPSLDPHITTAQVRPQITWVGVNTNESIVCVTGVTPTV